MVSSSSLPTHAACRTPHAPSPIISIIGLGYVGLPLAVEFGKKFRIIGFDINELRVKELQGGQDHTLECSPEELASAPKLEFTTDADHLRAANVHIVTVPTPIDDYKRPDLGCILAASRTVGRILKKGDIVVYESTVYPGCTEEDCVPVLEKESSLKFNVDFFCGYSPERINPGDKEHRLPTIRKVVSGSTPEVADLLNNLYGSIITAGTHLASSIKVAEAAKVIENTQRDLNIAFVNELSLICDRLDIDTLEVLEAAGTKWNFLNFRPGLVGGHCIGVDPYYLTHKAQGLGYHPEIILAGRRVNDNMEYFVAGKLVKRMIQQDIQIKGSRILVLGVTFKENCPDVRNTRVVNIVRELETFGAKVDVVDPWADATEFQHEYNLELTPAATGPYDGILLAVAHRQFFTLDLTALKSPSCVIFDVKGVLPRDQVDLRL